MLKSIFSTTNTATLDLNALLISILFSIILGIIIALTHKYTSKYSKNFLITIATLPLLVEAVMLMVNGNLGTSVAIMGAFSLVRFRSIPGTSREILTVFFTMAVGLATGMGQIYFALILTIIGCLLIVVLTKTKIFENIKDTKILKILIPENLDYEDVFTDILEEYTKDYKLEKTKTTNMGSMFELTYNIHLKTTGKEKEFIDKLRTRNSNLKISIERENADYEL